MYLWKVGHWRVNDLTCWNFFQDRWFQPLCAFFISLKGIVQPSDDNTKVYAAVGSAVVLPCVFSSDLIPSSLVWEKLRNPYFKPARLPASFSATPPDSEVPWDRSATIKDAMFDDEGTYRCSGTVQGQRQTRTMQLVMAKSKLTHILYEYESLTFLSLTKIFICLISPQLTVTSRQRKTSLWRWPASCPTQVKSPTTSGFTWPMTLTAPSRLSPSRKGKLLASVKCLSRTRVNGHVGSMGNKAA